MADELLSDYLARAGRKSWAWGDADCYLFVADWIECRTGIDPAGEYRGAYTTAREARNLIRLGGGPCSFADALLRRAGCVATSHPSSGDVGLVRVAFKRWRNGRVVLIPVGAICVRERLWAIKPADKTGLIMADFPIVRAWTLSDA